MNKVLNNLSTFIINSCQDVTNHEIINNELVITTKTNKIFDKLYKIRSQINVILDPLDFSILKIISSSGMRDKKLISQLKEKF